MKNRIDSKVKRILSKYKNNQGSYYLDSLEKEDWDFIKSEIEKLYRGFFEDIHVDRIFLSKVPVGEDCGCGQFVTQYQIEGNSFNGIRYFTIHQGCYLGVEYRIY